MTFLKFSRNSWKWTHDPRELRWTLPFNIWAPRNERFDNFVFVLFLFFLILSMQAMIVAQRSGAWLVRHSHWNI